ASELVAASSAVRKYLAPALRQYLLARDLCPLMAKAQMKLAAYVRFLDASDSTIAYLERAAFVVPADPELHYLCGLQRMLDGQSLQASASWRRSLELSGAFLEKILERSRPQFAISDILEQVLPDQADLLWAAAWKLFPEPGSRAQRRPFLERALCRL